jgi:hypothetical protein
MKATEFCYWLQGMFELTEVKSLNEEQTDLIRRHLAMAFQHDIDKRPSEEEQAKLNKLHRPDPSTVMLRC